MKAPISKSNLYSILVNRLSQRAVHRPHQVSTGQVHQSCRLCHQPAQVRVMRVGILQSLHVDQQHPNRLLHRCQGDWVPTRKIHRGHQQLPAQVRDVCARILQIGTIAQRQQARCMHGPGQVSAGQVHHCKLCHSPTFVRRVCSRILQSLYLEEQHHVRRGRIARR